MKYVFRMTNFEYKVETVCTHNFIGKWQAEGFTLTGLKQFPDYISVMDINPTEIPTNVNPFTEEEK